MNSQKTSKRNAASRRPRRWFIGFQRLVFNYVTKDGYPNFHMGTDALVFASRDDAELVAARLRALLGNEINSLTGPLEVVQAKAGIGEWGFTGPLCTANELLALLALPKEH